MYNKRKFNKLNDKKILHKVKKQWVTISLALFLLIGGSAIATHVTASADSLNNQASVIKVQQNESNQNQLSNITNQAKQLHTKLVNNSTKQTLRLGSRYGRKNSSILRNRYRRSNNRRLLKNSGYKYSNGFVFNKYAPNNKRAIVPKRLNLRYLTWAEGHFGKLNLKLFTHKRNGWIELSNRSVRKYRNNLKAIYRISNRHHNNRHAVRNHINYISHRTYNKYNRQLRNYRYSMSHGSRRTRRYNKHAYYMLKSRMKSMRIRKARKHHYSNNINKTQLSNNQKQSSNNVNAQPSDSTQPSDNTIIPPSDTTQPSDNSQPSDNTPQSDNNIPSDSQPSDNTQPSDNNTPSDNQPSDDVQPSDNSSSDNSQENTAQIMQDAKQETLNDINNERQANGAQPLTETPDLDKLANMRAQQASVNFVHDRSDGTGLESDDAQQLGINLNSDTEENLADNYGDNGNQVADNANNDMMNNDADSGWGHRDNILNPEMKYIGIGVAPSQGDYQGDDTIVEDFTD